MLWIKILSHFRSQCVGVDSQGNRYYRKLKTKFSPEKRWVLYKNKAHPSHIPAAWHGWLHFTFNEFPIDVSSEQEKIFPNFEEDFKRSFSSAKTPLYSSFHQQDYVAWIPPHKRNKS